MSFCHDVSDVGMAYIFCCVGNITVLIFQESWRRCISSVMCRYTDKAQRNIPTSLTERGHLRDVTPSSSSHERFPLTSAFESVASRSTVGVTLCVPQQLPYFSIDNARFIYTKKGLNS